MFIVIKKRQIFFTLFLALIVCLLSLKINGSAYASVFFNAQPSRLVPVYEVETEQHRVAISFDAAWGADKTDEIMAVLKQYNANATFFLVGFWVEDYPEETKRIAENGFEIGTHSNMHLDMATISEEEVKKDLTSSIETIKNTSGISPSVFRPPYGSYNNTLIRTASSLNLTTVQWSIDTLDWKGLSATEIAGRVSAKVKAGSIILCHNNADNVVEATKLIMILLQQKNLKCVSVSELLLKGETYVDNLGIQRQKN